MLSSCTRDHATNAIVHMNHPSRQRLWVAADQVASSLSSIAQLAVVAHLAGSASLGAFALVMGIFLVFAGSLRAAAGEVLLHRRLSDSRESSSAAVTLALLGAIAITPLTLTTAILPGVPWKLSAAMAIATPALVWRDNLRFVPYADGRSSSSARWSVGNTLVDIAVLSVALISTGSLIAALIMIGISAALMGAIQARRESIRVTPRRAVAWFRLNRVDSQYFALEALVGGSSSYIAIPAVGGALSVSAAGALRVTQSLLGPVGIVLGALRYSDVAHVASLLSSPKHGPLRRYLLRSATMLVLISLAIGAIVASLPLSVLSVIAGDTASEVKAITLLMGLQKGLSAASVPYSVALKTNGSGAWTVLLRLATVSLTFVGAISGAQLGGLIGVVAGMCVAAAILLLAHLLSLEVILRRKMSADRHTPA